MKVRLLFALVGMAISFALPTHAQQTNTPDPKLRERVISRFKAFTDALAKKDAAAVAANFTKDATLVTPYGPVWGWIVQRSATTHGISTGSWPHPGRKDAPEYAVLKPKSAQNRALPASR